VNAFRSLLVVILVTVVVYTSVVVVDHGLDLLPIFFGDMVEMTWPGQFNLDFLGFLVLSGFWLAWRHEFSAAGLALGVLGLFGGVPVLSVYLLVASFRCDGDVPALLMGAERARRLADAS